MSDELTKAVEAAMTAISLVSTIAEREKEAALMYGANRAWRILDEECRRRTSKPTPTTNQKT